MNTDKGRRKKLFQLGKDRSLVGAPNFPALIRLRIWVHLCLFVRFAKNDYRGFSQ